MTQNKITLIVSLTFPVIALASLAGYRSYNLNTGEEYTLPISGYDPRDLLSGRYLTYRVNYGIPDLCKDPPRMAENGQQRKSTVTAYVCLKPRSVRYGSNRNCSVFIKGRCVGGRLKAGIERFYIPESKARDYDRRLRDEGAEIVISIKANGRASVKGLRFRD